MSGAVVILAVGDIVERLTADSAAAQAEFLGICGALLVYAAMLGSGLWNLIFDRVTDVKIFCSHCGKYIPNDMDWRCGYCDAINTNRRYHPVFSECQTCKRETLAYTCTHCSQIVLFDESEDRNHPARQYVADRREMPRDLLQEKMRVHDLKKTDLEHEIEIEQLKMKLVRIKASTEFKQEVTAQEKLRKKFSEQETHVLGALLLAKEERAKNAEQYKDDPELLEMKELALRAFLSEEGVEDFDKEKGTV